MIPVNHPFELDPGLPALLPGGAGEAALLRRSERHCVYRLESAGGSCIVKSFRDPEPLELQVYTLLERLGVPILPVIARTARSLALEDLERSPRWRQASEADMGRAETGRAVAAWYRRLHEAGFRYLARPENRPGFLRSWVDEIGVEQAALAGEKLGLGGCPGWAGILGDIERLAARYLSFPQTFNYNDFASVNLALSRSAPLQAVVYDYDCFRTGTVYSDWRNVVSALTGEGKLAFQAAFGPVDEQEGLLDGPLSSLYGLVVAARREKLPGWAVPLIEEARSGALERSIRLAVGICNSSRTSGSFRSARVPPR